MKACDHQSKVLFEIVGTHKQSLNQQSCINRDVRLYDDNGFLVQDIILSSSKAGLLIILLQF